MTGVTTNLAMPKAPDTCCVLLTICSQTTKDPTLSQYSTKKRVGVGSSLRHLTHEMYMPNAKTRRQAPNATYIPLKHRLRLLPNAKKSTQKKRNVHGQRKKLASPNARDTNMLLSFALGDAKVPDARYFAFWWNIGFKKYLLWLATDNSIY